MFEKITTFRVSYTLAHPPSFARKANPGRILQFRSMISIPFTVNEAKPTYTDCTNDARDEQAIYNELA